MFLRFCKSVTLQNGRATQAGRNERREGELKGYENRNKCPGFAFLGSGKLVPSQCPSPSTSWECTLNLNWFVLGADSSFPNSQRPKIQTILNFYLGRVIISTNKKKSLKNNTELCCTIWILTVKVY